MPVPRFRSLDLSPIKGAWVSLGHRQVPPALPSRFGSSRYTKEQQQSHPDLPMTRLVKDVLRVGQWKVGDRSDGKPILWNVSGKTLNDIAQNFHLAQSRGVAMNLGKSHGDPQTRLIPTDELIAPIDAAIVENGVLWLSVYVTPEQAKYLTNPAMKVSPGVYDNWVDGFGNAYPTQLIHVAVTDNPVVAGQGPFVALDNSRKTRNFKMKTNARKLPKNMTTRERLLHRWVVRTLAGDMSGNVMQGLTGIDFNTLVEQLERLIALTDLPVKIPDTQREATFHDWFESVLGVLEDIADGQEGEDGGRQNDMVMQALGDLPAELSNALRRRKRNQAKMLSNRNRGGKGKTISGRGCGRKAFGP